MIPADLSTIHALAMEKSGKYKPADIRNVLASTPYSSLSDFHELREFLFESSLDGFFPEEKSWNEAHQIIDKSLEKGIKSYSVVSSQYPKYLREIDNAPNVLHVRGNEACLNKLPGVAVVGARKITKNGIVIAERIAAYLASQGLVIVSGLALGVDAHAHLGALSTGLPSSTIAVLAHGLEVAKPVANKAIGDRILESGGVWVSEYSIGTPARPPQFVARNRIQLGLSVGSVIVEADIRSGSITQAKFCIKQRRPLFAVVPQDSTNRLGLLSAGTEYLVAEHGATPLKTKDDYPTMLEKFSRQYSLMTGM